MSEALPRSLIVCLWGAKIPSGPGYQIGNRKVSWVDEQDLFMTALSSKPAMNTRTPHGRTIAGPGGAGASGGTIVQLASWDSEGGEFLFWGLDRPEFLNTLKAVRLCDALWVTFDAPTIWDHRVDAIPLPEPEPLKPPPPQRYSGVYSATGTVRVDVVFDRQQDVDSLITISFDCRDGNCMGAIDAHGITPSVNLTLVDGVYLWEWDDGHRPLASGRPFGCPFSVLQDLFRAGELRPISIDENGSIAFKLEWVQTWTLDIDDSFDPARCEVTTRARYV